MTFSQCLDTIEVGVLTPGTPVQGVHFYQEKQLFVLHDLDLTHIDSNVGTEFNPEGPQDMSSVLYRFTPRTKVAPKAFALWQSFNCPL